LDTTNRPENNDSTLNETNDNVRASLDQVNIDLFLLILITI